MMEKSSIDSLDFVEENIKYTRNAINEATVKAGRNADDIRLMAVTKTVPPALVNRAFQCGIRLMGENRVQEFLEKRPFLDMNGREAHLIGHLQTNKVKKIVGQVDLIQSVDSFRLAREIGKTASGLDITADILLEVNIGREESKTGFMAEQLVESAAEIAEENAVRIRGLMCVAPISSKITDISLCFYKMRHLFVDISSKKIDNVYMDILSMGMSDDYFQAIAEGSNLVRLGSAIFGKRL